MRHALLAGTCLVLGGAFGWYLAGGGAGAPQARAGRVIAEADTHAILEEIGRLRQELRGRGGIAPPRTEDVAPTEPASAAVLEAGVVLDPTDVESAVRVLEAYVYRRERRWWQFNLERFVAGARAQEQKLKASWAQSWLVSLDEARADLQAVGDADTLEAFVNRHRRAFEVMPAQLDALDPLWGDWRRFRGEIR